MYFAYDIHFPSIDKSEYTMVYAFGFDIYISGKIKIILNGRLVEGYAPIRKLCQLILILFEDYGNRQIKG